MREYLLSRLFVTWMGATLTLAFTPGCSPSELPSAIGSSSGDDFRGDPAARLMGLRTALDLNQSYAVATNIDPNVNTNVGAMFTIVQPNLPAAGGAESNVVILQSATDLAGRYASAFVDKEAATDISDRLAMPVDFSTGFSSGGTDLLPDGLMTALAKKIVFRFTGEAATAAEIQALKDAMKEFRTLLPNSPDGKRQMLVLIATIVLASHHWY